MENTQEKSSSFFRFEDLRVYDKSIDYCSWLLENLAEPKTEVQKQFIASFCRSANDIALNIAEGSAHPKSHFDEFLKVSKTALRECVVYTELAFNCGLFTEEQHDQSRESLMELTRMLGALILSLTRNHRRSNEPESDDRAQDSTDDLDILKF